MIVKWQSDPTIAITIEWEWKEGWSGCFGGDPILRFPRLHPRHHLGRPLLRLPASIDGGKKKKSWKKDNRRIVCDYIYINCWSSVGTLLREKNLIIYKVLHCWPTCWVVFLFPSSRALLYWPNVWWCRADKKTAEFDDVIHRPINRATTCCAWW